MSDKLLDQIFNLKFTSKQLVKQSQKCAKEEKSERLKVKANAIFATSSCFDEAVVKPTLTFNTLNTLPRAT